MRTVNWALGDNPAVRNFSGEWFLTMMEGVVPRVALPRAVKPEHLQSINLPVLLFLGTKDNVVGSSKKAEKRAKNIPNICHLRLCQAMVRDTLKYNVGCKRG